MIRNPVPWPDGARCAVAFSFDVDADSFVHLGYPNDADNRIHSLAIARFGPQVGVPRLVDLFKRHEVPVTWFVPGWVMERYPAAVDAMLESKGEVAHHGYLHHNPVGLSEAEEEDAIMRAVDIIKRVTGQKPRGYRAPSWGVSRHTLPLLMKAGIDYDSSLMGDEIPYLLTYDGKRSIVELPTAHGLDDWTHYMNWRDFNYLLPVKAPAEAHAVYRAEFDAAWEYGGMWVAVWHPLVSGRLARAHEMHALVQHMRKKGKVWFARMEDIAAHVRKVIKTGEWTPRIDRMPYYKGRIPELHASGQPVMRATRKTATKSATKAATKATRKRKR
jgi:peptidoglycan/xylan/chitin deacetylase (PgdA/CDA1 family)